MQDADFLLTMAELAIAIVAFATIILVFRQSAGSELTHLQVLATRTIVELGLAIAIFSLLPIVLVHAGADASVLWRVSNGTFGAFLIVFWISYAERRRRATKAGDPARGITFFLVVGGGCLVGTFLLADGVWWGRFSAFSFGLFWSLVSDALAFLWSLAVFASPSRSSK